MQPTHFAVVCDREFPAIRQGRIVWLLHSGYSVTLIFRGNLQALKSNPFYIPDYTYAEYRKSRRLQFKLARVRIKKYLETRQ